MPVFACGRGITAVSLRKTLLQVLLPTRSSVLLLLLLKSASSMTSPQGSTSSSSSANKATTIMNPPQQQQPYPIGTPGAPWTDKEKKEWFLSRKLQRSYQDEVVSKLFDNPIDGFEIEKYGTLSVENKEEGYPLYVAKSKDWDATNKPSVLITGGVHGYEMSGVQGAIQFLKSSKAIEYSQIFNLIVIPCVSPWGYEVIERWNSQAVDPNRSFNPNVKTDEEKDSWFKPEPPTQESLAVIGYLDKLNIDQWMCHFDLHETTDTDKTEFRPSKRARDGVILSPPPEQQSKDGDDDDGTPVVVVDPDAIPDGFYLVSDKTNPQGEWHKAMIDSVKKVTHIAPADADGTIIGEEVSQEGVIIIPKPSSLGLCMGVTNADYSTTTEVYPDSPKASPQQCNDAQVACIIGGLDYIVADKNLKSCSNTSEQ